MPGPRLTPRQVLAGYATGIFPMAESRTGPISWYAPDPRAVLPLERFHISRSLAQTVRKGNFEIRINHDFEAVMRACAAREDTWISEPIIRVYTTLHRAGLAHSVESWQDGRFAGGLYGVSLGGAFFGESMISHVTDASKVALVALVERLRDRGFALLDVQYQTPHLARFGVVEIPRWLYEQHLSRAIHLVRSFV